MANFDLSQYQTVQDRIDILRRNFPRARLVAEIAHLSETDVIIRTELYLDPLDVEPTCVDFAHEVKDSNPVNRTSWIENATTSSYGRCISLLGLEYSPKGLKPSREEMEKVARAAVKQTRAKASETPQEAANKAEITALIEKATDKKELDELFAVALDAGLSEVLRPAFTKRKNELNS
jgi:hypothetical protein